MWLWFCEYVTLRVDMWHRMHYFITCHSLGGASLTYQALWQNSGNFKAFDILCVTLWGPLRDVLNLMLSTFLNLRMHLRQMMIRPHFYYLKSWQVLLNCVPGITQQYEFWSTQSWSTSSTPLPTDFRYHSNFLEFWKTERVCIILVYYI